MPTRHHVAVTSAGISLVLLLSGCAPGADSAVPSSPATLSTTAPTSSSAPTPTSASTSNPGSASTPRSTSTPKSTPRSTSTAKPSKSSLAPLTGVASDASDGSDEEDLAGPSIAAKIDNHPAARPQVGLAAADIVFEELVEGGLTGYLAVWHSSIPSKLGPVRTVRFMDADIATPFGGIIAYSGGQERYVEQMETTGLHNAIYGQDATADTIYRTESRLAPHNVLVRAQRLVARHTNLDAPEGQFTYADAGETPSAVAAGTVTSTFPLSFSPESTRAWAWDGARSLWARTQDGAPDLDPTGFSYGANNVVVLRVAVSADQDETKTELIGSGEAWVASGGSVLHASWSKDSAAGPIELVDDAGEPIALQPGNTWVELVPLTGSVGLPVVY
jgi:hypothetical protein